MLSVGLAVSLSTDQFYKISAPCMYEMANGLNTFNRCRLADTSNNARHLHTHKPKLPNCKAVKLCLSVLY